MVALERNKMELQHLVVDNMGTDIWEHDALDLDVLELNVNLLNLDFMEHLSLDFPLFCS